MMEFFIFPKQKSSMRLPTIPSARFSQTISTPILNSQAKSSKMCFISSHSPREETSISELHSLLREWSMILTISIRRWLLKLEKLLEIKWNLFQKVISVLTGELSLFMHLRIFSKTLILETTLWGSPCSGKCQKSIILPLLGAMPKKKLN